LDRGTYDVALLTKPALMPLGLVFLEIAEEPLHLITGSEVTETDPVRILETQPFIRFNRDAVVGTLIEAWLQERGIRVAEAMELENLEAISSMVHANLGVSIVPRACVQSAYALQLKTVPLGPQPPSRVLGLAYRKEHPKLRVIEEIHAAMLRAVAENAPDETASGPDIS
jgi:DNA-binding transcriptional LysR family regulator